MTLQWFLSSAVRQATAMRRHVQKLVNHQRDLLSAQALTQLHNALTEMDLTIQQHSGKAELQQRMDNLEKVANNWLKPYPNPAWRENVEVLLVALAIAMGIRTFLLQPFKIPTGSMQPTLYGVTSYPDHSRRASVDEMVTAAEKIEVPGGLERVRQWFAGVSYLVIKAKADGPIQDVRPPFKLLIFNIYQTLKIGGVTHWVFFPPDYGSLTLEKRAGLNTSKIYHKGDDVVRMKIIAGDHLFVDRLTYNFRPPKRGEIIVFETKGIPERARDYFGIPGDQFYIKRLVGLGGERIQIGEDRHLAVNGERLTASIPHFERLYSFDPKLPPEDSRYSGHVDGPFLAPMFHNKLEGFRIPDRHYLAMGDNTVNSLDSRSWGSFPSEYVIGKGFFVYWPLSGRFGWGYHR